MIADDSITPRRFFERLWASLPPTIDQLIADYEGRLHASAIKWAIWEARLQGQRRASYLRAILDRLVAQGLTTAAAAQAEADRRHLRQAAGAEVAAARDRPLEGVANAAAYRPVDPELVREYAARIYGDDAPT